MEKLKVRKGGSVLLFVVAEVSYPSLSLRYGQTLSCRLWKLSLFQGHQSR